ncbi:alanine--tRNA ligase [Cytophagaceae bacterium DM2B3-1]|uniref:Alanine--tRNA ligase n=1 Tax=Xanthocytophaga flava TaxID=3048013 RepID=A0ABT7CQT6_9BACT|nr:alanine--tRNA ligase [Xanthocytophaga flavus]MDJ1496108.1 alanine--tRNA ligase [Xanthocytophaga flavus]
MTSHEIRQQFLDFFRSKGHLIVPSAPLVLKNDPTLMFTNSGMVQFKDYFLGNGVPPSRRIADTQKCLRVSGKHNDLEDVGFDGTHHTMFEMLGNWSFGDYFKRDAIAWSWELLTDVLKIPKDRLYATVFGGDTAEGLASDEEAKDLWKQYLPEHHILYGNKKDNFWEMGEQGPCGPCSEIHVDLRSDAERAAVPGETLVNKDHPKVIEIWNNVFMQFERKADKSLVTLPAKHVDTGMGFERLCMVLQGVEYTYDTDVFTPFIRFIEQHSNKKYTGSYDRKSLTDVAMRVVVDHIRAVAFTIADGQLPSNNGSGYVIRRILRRAVRYYYSFLEIKEPFLHRLLPLLANEFATVFPELKAQEEFVKKVILEEEKSFLRTLEDGLERLEAVEIKSDFLDGRTVFELYDTYGFPADLTRLIMSEKGIFVDENGFKVALDEQKNRSKADAEKQVGDWVILDDTPKVTFVGYDELSVNDSKVLKYRITKDKKGEQFQIVLNKTPFYPEGGGQVGDTGVMSFDGEEIKVVDTKKENDLVIHVVDKLPADIKATVIAHVSDTKRHLTENNHSATHLLHAALRRVLGTHVAQKGSLVNEQYLRFDFSHFEKVTDEQLAEIEHIVNQKIRENIALQEDRSLPIEEARKAGAMMLFGEKYGDTVRMITFDPGYSRELCGGCHVSATGKIGLFKITSEAGVAAGVRRIEAITADAAETYVDEQTLLLKEIKELLKNPKDVKKAIADLLEEKGKLTKQVEVYENQQLQIVKEELIKKIQIANGVQVVAEKVSVPSVEALRQLAYDLKAKMDQAFIVLAADIQGKPQIAVIIAEELVKEKNLHAGNIVKELAKEIKGGGGGQPFFATAGGSDVNGLDRVVEKGKQLV